jgi:hypothetical protein
VTDSRAASLLFVEADAATGTRDRLAVSALQASSFGFYSPQPLAGRST